MAYYAEKQRAALYTISMKRRCGRTSPLERVVDGMFDLVERLYGMRVTERAGRAGLGSAGALLRRRTTKTARSWAASTPIGIPRENKRGGAWMEAFITGGPAAGWLPSPHVGVICGNLTPPVGGKPALLTHREVETIFHEFGHLLHHLLSRVEVHGLAGTNVAWDFVELPSQIMENWCWERDALDLFARHWETGEPIPDELFQKMKRARTFRAANAQMRQLGFGFVDLLLHTRYARRSMATRWPMRARILQQFTPAPLPPDHAMIAAFTHLFAEPGGLWRGLLLVQVGRGAGCGRLHALPRRRHFQPRNRRRVPRQHPLQGRQRRSGGAVPPVHGSRSGSACAAGEIGFGVVKGGAFLVRPGAIVVSGRGKE